MEKKIGAEDKIDVMSVLTEGHELATELKRQLDPPILDELKKQLCDDLLEQILSHYDRAIELLDCVALVGDSEESLDHRSRDQPHGHVSKKRKTMARWSEQVRVETGAVFEGQRDDGYNWRKYGQKVILGANHPRAYYRCTHRNTQGCLATKWVQRTDDDSSVFDVLYKGKHSCIQERNKVVHKGNVKKEEIETVQLPSIKQKNNKKTNPVGDREDDDAPALTPLGYDSGFLSGQGSIATTSESYLSLSQCEVNDFAIGYGLPASEFDFGEIVSNVSPIPDFPLGDWDFSIDEEMDFNVLQFLDNIK